jgi:hypothetical protein
VICSSETSVETQQTTRRHVPEDNTLHNHRCENLKSYMVYEVLHVGLQWVGRVARVMINSVATQFKSRLETACSH